MAHNEDRTPLRLELLKLMEAFRLKEHISDGESFIDDQYFRIDIDRDCKSQPHKHTAGIGLYRLVDKIPDIGKSQYVVQPPVDLFFRETDHRPVQIDILQTGVLSVKSRAQFQKSADPSIYIDSSCRRRKHPGDDLQYSGFTGTVNTDDAYTFSLVYVKTDIMKSIMLTVFLFSGQTQGIFEPV